jgi:biotin carboxyl carrier protein
MEKREGRVDVERVEILVRLLHASRARELQIETDGWKVSMTKGAAPARSASGHLPSPLDEFAIPEPTDRTRITARMVGIFRAATPRLQVGSEVEAGQVVGAIESMKILNPLVSEVQGRVVAAPVEDGQPVEYGQPLLEIRHEEEE